MSDPEMKRDWRRRLKLSIIVAIIAITSLSIGIAIGQNSGIPLVKPFSAPITVVESDVRVISLTYTYDPLSDRITTAKTTLENTALTGRNCIVHVVLFDRDGNVMAQGSSSQVTVGGGSTLQVTISLNWSSGKSVSDLASGRVAVEQK
ncbi:MAG: hypothetical protein ACO2OZ_07045 [Acidilobaceae archaeon]